MSWSRGATVLAAFFALAGGVASAAPPVDRPAPLRFKNLIHVSSRPIAAADLRYFRPDKAWVNIADRYLVAVSIDQSGQWADALTADERKTFEEGLDWNRFSAVGAAIARKTPGYRLTIRKIAVQRAGVQLCVVARIDKPTANEPVAPSVSLQIVRIRAFVGSPPERWVLRSTDGRLLATSHGTGATKPSLCR